MLEQVSSFLVHLFLRESVFCNLPKFGFWLPIPSKIHTFTRNELVIPLPYEIVIFIQFLFSLAPEYSAFFKRISVYLLWKRIFQSGNGEISLVQRTSFVVSKSTSEGLYGWGNILVHRWLQNNWEKKRNGFVYHSRIRYSVESVKSRKYTNKIVKCWMFYNLTRF